jgi:hypothetical protein
LKDNKTDFKKESKKDFKKELEKHPHLKKIYVFADKQRLSQSQSRGVINNIISSVLADILILFMYVSVKYLVIAVAGIIFNLINVGTSCYAIHKNKCKKQNIAMIITMGIMSLIIIVVAIIIGNAA